MKQKKPNMSITSKILQWIDKCREFVHDQIGNFTKKLNQECPDLFFKTVNITEVRSSEFFRIAKAINIFAAISVFFGIALIVFHRSPTLPISSKKMIPRNGKDSGPEVPSLFSQAVYSSTPVME